MPEKLKCHVSGKELTPEENKANKPIQVTLPNNVMVEVRAWVGNRPHDSVLSQEAVMTSIEQAATTLRGGVEGES